MRRLPSMFLTLLALAAATGTAHAQRAVSRRPARAPSGVVINAHLSAMPGFSIGGRDFDTRSNLGMGLGVGAQIGYVVDPRFLIYAGADLGRLGAAAEDLTNHGSFTIRRVACSAGPGRDWPRWAGGRLGRHLPEAERAFAPRRTTIRIIQAEDACRESHPSSASPF